MKGGNNVAWTFSPYNCDKGICVSQFLKAGDRYCMISKLVTFFIWLINKNTAFRGIVESKGNKYPMTGCDNIKMMHIMCMEVQCNVVCVYVCVCVCACMLVCEI